LAKKNIINFYLEVWTGNTFRKLSEQGHHYFLEFSRLNDIKNLLQLVQEHDLVENKIYPIDFISFNIKTKTYLFWRMSLWPELEKRHNDGLGETWVLFQKLNYAVRQLGVVDRQGLHFMQRKQHLEQKHFVLLFQRQSETVDDAAEDLEKFGNAVVVFRLIYELVENVVDLLANVGAETKKFAVDPVQGCFQKVSLSRIFRVEQVQ
jgi:hypothetical protein